MPAPTILILFAIPQDLRQALGAQYPLVDLAALKAESADLSGFEIAATTSMGGIDAAMMAALPALKLVVCNGAGLDRIDLGEATRRGIAIAHTPDELTEDTADTAIALLYATARRTVEADRFVRDGRWTNGERMTPSRRVRDMKMGIVGLGKIGSGVAWRARGIGMEVAYSGRAPKPGVELHFEPDVATLAAASDVLVLSCAGGAETHHLVNARVLEALGEKGILINIARGSVVDEEALITALATNRIAAAGLDVFASEPRIDPRFYALPNVVLQPHYASLTHETRAAMLARILGDIECHLGGRTFFNAAARDRY